MVRPLEVLCRRPLEVPPLLFAWDARTVAAVSVRAH